MDDVKLDTSEADAKLKKQARYLSPNDLVKAGQRAINRALSAGNTQLSREVRKTVNLRASSVKEAVSLKRARGLATDGEIRVEFKSIPLKEFKPRQTNKGLSVRIFKGAALQKFPKGFIVESLNGQAFMRVGDSRLPIKLLTGPSIRSQAEAALPAVRKRAEAVLEQRMRFEVGRQIERANK